MARPEPRWGNVEKQVVQWMKSRTGRYVATETTTQLEQYLPAYRVQRVGGTASADPTGLTKIIQIEIETLAADRGALWDAVADAETAMFVLAANGLPGWYVDEVTETFPAAVDDEDNPGVRRASATYGLAVRPQPTTT